MKKIRVIFVALISFLISTSWVSAECDATESNRLNSLAVNVKSSYEIVELEVPIPDGFNPPDGLTDEELENYVLKRDFFRIHINNITEDLYVIITNKETNETRTFRHNDTENGNVYFDVEVGTEIMNYTIVVYASENNDCASKKLRTLYLTTPMYNVSSQASVCRGIEEFYLCHEYLSVNVSFAKFDTLVEQYRKGQLKADGSIKPAEEVEKGFFGFIKEHKGITILAIVIIAIAGGSITFVIVKKQRSRIV